MSSSNEDLSQKLSQLGLNTNEVKILLYLYSVGEQKKADELANETDVPLARTYEALDTLEQNKFIIVHQGRPRYYVAQDPQIAIQTYIAEKESQLQEELENNKKLAKNILDNVQDLYLQHHTKIEPGELMQQFSTLEEAEKQTLEIIQSAEDEILIFTHVFHWFNRMENALKEAVDRGCSVKVLMHPEDSEAISRGQLDQIGIQVKSIPKEGIKTRGTLVDGKSLIFVIWADELRSETDSRRIYRPQFSSNPGIIDVFYGYFNFLWSQ